MTDPPRTPWIFPFATVIASVTTGVLAATLLSPRPARPAPSFDTAELSLLRHELAQLRAAFVEAATEAPLETRTGDPIDDARPDLAPS